MSQQRNEDQDLLDLYRRSRSEMPSLELDAKILNAARSASKRRGKQWLWGLSTAAILVLSFSVTMQLIPIENEKLATSDATISKELAPAEEASVQGLQLPESQKMPKSIAMPDMARMQSAPQPVQSRMIDSMQSPANPEILMDQFNMAGQAAESNMLGGTQKLYLPMTQIELRQRFPQMRITQSSERLIQIFDQDILLASLEPIENEQVRLIAYPEAERLGLAINYYQSQSHVCETSPDLSTCQFAENIIVYFKQNQLIKIEWVQQKMH